MVDFSKYLKKEVQEEKEVVAIEVLEPPMPKARKPVKKVLPPIENIAKPKIIAKKPEKDALLKEFDFNISGIRVMLELNDKTLTRTKSGILGEHGIKNYYNMTEKELDNELSKLIAKGVLKVLKGDD